jgi:hypothetical protein
MDDNLIRALEQYDIFTNASQRTQLIFYNFFNTLKIDFNMCNYNIVRIVEYIFKKASEYTSYSTIFSLILDFDSKIKIFIKSPNFENLLQKYNDVQLHLPIFDFNKQNSSLSSYIFYKLTESKSSIFYETITYNDIFETLSIVIKHGKNDKFSSDIQTVISIVNNDGTNTVGMLDIIMDDNFDINSYNTTFSERNRQIRILKNKIFKLLIQYKNYTKECFSTLLTFLYCRQDMLNLEIIKRLRPEMLSVNLTQLIKIIFYGRDLALQFVIDNVPNEFNQIVEQYNPYDIELLKIHGKTNNDKRLYILEDIWNHWNWGNDEGDKTIIGYCNHNNVIEIMKKYSNHDLENNNDVIIKWLKIVALRDNVYFIETDKLINMLKLDLTTKDGIIKAVELIGHALTWRIIREKSDDMLKLLLN